MAPVLNAVTETVHLVQGGAVNWTLVADDRGVMLIDAGYPGDREDVLASLRQLGYQPEDVRAILLTHAHIDHLGSAIWFAKTHGTPSTVTPTRSATPSASIWSRRRRSTSRCASGGPGGRCGPPT